MSRRRRRPAWILLALTVLVLGVAWRVLVVAPRRAARLQAQALGEEAWERIQRTRLPLLASPGFAEPGAGEGGGEPALDGRDRQSLTTTAERLASVSWIAQEEPTLTCLLAPVRLALGDDRAARIAWERCAIHARGEAQVRAWIGLGVLELRAGARARDEQDRRYAAEAALSYLDRPPPGDPWAADAQHARAFAFLLLGRAEEAKRLLDQGVPSRAALLRPPGESATPRPRMGPFLPNGDPAP